MSRKNVLLITVDQWRGDFLPWAAIPFLDLPNLAALAREATVFDRHYSVTTPCGPSRASLLTGLYQMNHRAVQNTVPLDARHTNLAKEMRRLGYDPAIAGYTTTTPDPRSTHPNDPRFRVLGDLMDGFRSLANLDPYPAMHEYFRWVAAKGFTLPDNPHDVWRPRNGAPGPTHQPACLPAELSDTAWITEVALSYLQAQASEPWFLHLCYWRPHPPFANPEPFNLAYSAEDMPAPVRAPSPAEEAAQHPLLRFYLEHTRSAAYFRGAEGRVAELSPEAVRQARATYCGMLNEVDGQLGRVLAFLRESGQWQDTLIILTSDHGELLGDHHLFGKSGYFDPVFHVPLLIRDPLMGGRQINRIDAFTESVDLMPTILAWLKTEVPRACDGRSLLPWCHGETPPAWRDAAHFEFDFRDLYYVKAESALGVEMDAACFAGIRDRHHKYVHFAALPPILFDLDADPAELLDRSGDPAKAPVLLDLAQKMLSWRLIYAERTLTGYRATPQGLQERR